MSAFRDRFNRLRGQSASTETAAEQTTGAAEIDERELSAATPDQDETDSDRGGRLDASASASESEQTHTSMSLPADVLEIVPEWEPHGVRLARNESGEFLLKETRYPVSYQHGIHAFSEWGEASSSLAAFHGIEEVMGAGSHADEETTARLAGEEVLFLDLETTGLGAGAGNVPFMLGIAYFENGEYVVRQSLIRHPAEERAMLADLKERLPRFRYLVTYNGRTFDWPVMQSRFIMNGFGSRVWEPLHLDFLHPSRSIWRNTLVSCKLSYVEEERLGVFREDDLPGSEAPGRYFAYLADGDPQPLLDVFKHNEIDMLSLAALAIRFGHLLGGRIGEAFPIPTEPEELVRTGLWLERMGRHDSALPLLELVRTSERGTPAVWNRLAERDKRLGDWACATALWEKAADAAEQASGMLNWDAHVELSMYFEHRAKDIHQALHYGRTALELALSHPLSGKADSKRRKEIDALKHRIDRLLRKAGR
ncbi:ribonuclease H-like domain-containing protein [Paenibacillus kobensis]|uniref:ribonuclease H-like domain-containing protein n=1 Tax=Paenibacillus kobensis TaxID=59841 RepID=UPI000FDB2166|nr:ribonuclease H-like domain-containing protein [Paenibacillus kobensis]